MYESHEMQSVLFENACVFADVNDGSDNPGESYFNIKPEVSDI